MLPIFNSDTHCQACGEPLSLYGHCWQHDWPPMDPKQDAQASEPPITTSMTPLNSQQVDAERKQSTRNQEGP